MTYRLGGGRSIQLSYQGNSINCAINYFWSLSRMCSRHSLGLRSGLDSTDCIHAIVPPTSRCYYGHGTSYRCFEWHMVHVVGRSCASIARDTRTSCPSYSTELPGHCFEIKHSYFRMNTESSEDLYYAG